MKIRLPIRYLLLMLAGGCLPGSRAAFAQDCLPNGVKFSSQAQIDAFAVDFPDCTRILGDVVIEESTTGGITNLLGLSRLNAFGNYLEIHDNKALKNLKGLDSVTKIEGGLNIFGNPALQDLSGLEQLTRVSASLRLAFNHQLQHIKALQALQHNGGDLTFSDNGRLFNLEGLNALEYLGGNLVVIFNENLQNLQGLNALPAIGEGLLVEENPGLRSLNGLEKVITIGGNCLVINNRSLRSLEGLGALESIGGKLQIARNPFLEGLTHLKNLKKIDGLLQIFENLALESLSGLDSIDPGGIADLAILSCDILRSCSVKSVCGYLGIEENLASISRNGTGCNFRLQILDACSREGPSTSPPPRKDPVFFPNPTGGQVGIKGQGLEGATIEVADGFGRVLIKENLRMNTVDLTELAAGIYFIRLRTKRETITSRVIKVN